MSHYPETGELRSLKNSAKSLGATSSGIRAAVNAATSALIIKSQPGFSMAWSIGLWHSAGALSGYWGSDDDLGKSGASAQGREG